MENTCEPILAEKIFQCLALIDNILLSIEIGFKTKITNIPISEKYILTLLPLGQSRQYEKKSDEILIYEDLFLTNKDFYISLLSSKLGLNNRIYGRQCEVKMIDKDLFNEFCNKFHYLKTGNCKVRIGLFYENELIMAAGFSKPKLMYRDHLKYQSAFLIRLVTKHGTTITGGLSKILNKYIITENPDDIVTYIDTDFFDGASFKSQGFETYKTLESLTFWLHLESKTRFSTDQLIHKLNLKDTNFISSENIPKGYIPIYNHGTIKMVKVVRSSN